MEFIRISSEIQWTHIYPNEHIQRIFLKLFETEDRTKLSKFGTFLLCKVFLRMLRIENVVKKVVLSVWYLDKEIIFRKIK